MKIMKLEVKQTKLVCKEIRIRELECNMIVTKRVLRHRSEELKRKSEELKELRTQIAKKNTKKKPRKNKNYLFQCCRHQIQRHPHQWITKGNPNDYGKVTKKY